MAKDKKGKKKGDKAKKEPKSTDEPKLSEVVDESSKQFYLLQIKDLEQKLLR